MTSVNLIRNSLAALTLAVALIGCGNDKSNPISAFQPEIVNNADAFQFQVTDASHVTASVEYPWENTGLQATIDHSTALTGGSATVSVLDADGTQVYTNGLIASGTHESTAGTAGTWTVRVVLSDFSGTANFRAEKL